MRHIDKQQRLSKNRLQHDLDDTTTTDHLNVNSDDYGFYDGMEDINQNGRMAPSETDPLDPDSFP